MELLADQSKTRLRSDTVEYAYLAEEMGKSPSCGAEVFNCSAPDTGNMEVLERYGTAEHKERWLEPLLDGEIRSRLSDDRAGDVASSDATNIESRIERDGDDYVHQRPQVVDLGRRRPALRDLHLHGQDRPDRRRAMHQQSMILVPRRHARVSRCCGHCRSSATTMRRTATAKSDFENVRVPASNILLGEGRGFEIAQGRLGPGRIHHCMRRSAWPSARSS